MQGMAFEAVCLFDSVAKSGGDFGQAFSLFALVTVHGNVCPQSFLGGISFQASEWMRVSVFIIHGEGPRHVSNGAAIPSVIGPLVVNEATEGFLRSQFSPGGDKTLSPAIKGSLKFLHQCFRGGVWPQSHCQVSVVHKAETDQAKVWCS